VLKLHSPALCSHIMNKSG